ncbi:MAG: DUF4097 family beta strand repeat-containing protein, partial [Ilumatobacteraceae bacterium]
AGTSTVELEPARPGDADALDLIERARVTLDGSPLVVHVPADGLRGLLRRAPEVVARIQVPTGSALQAATKSADVTVNGTLGQLRLSTASGDGTIGDVTGDVSVDAASGDVRLGPVGGSVRAKSASGDVSIDCCRLDVSAHSSSGDVRVGDVGGELDAKTASGDITADAVGGAAAVRTASGDVRLGGVGAGRSDVIAVSGDVSIRVAPHLAVWLDVSSVSGRIRSTLDDAADGGSDAPASLTVHTVSGDITLAPSGRTPELAQS